MLLEKYTSDWIEHFADVKREIDESLCGFEYQIEHIGSTSIPKLASKPIIDIDIIYKTNDDFEKIKCGLIEIGYYHNGNQGIAEREVFKRNSEQKSGILDTIKHHLYVCPINSKALERHILFRDFLRKNELERLKYETMKYNLADKANQQKKVYAELKELHINDFIDLIIEQEKLKLRAKKNDAQQLYSL